MTAMGYVRNAVAVREFGRFAPKFGHGQVAGREKVQDKRRGKDQAANKNTFTV